MSFRHSLHSGLLINLWKMYVSSHDKKVQHWFGIQWSGVDVVAILCIFTCQDMFDWSGSRQFFLMIQNIFYYEFKIDNIFDNLTPVAMPETAPQTCHIAYI